MKKISTILFLSITAAGFSQTSWPTKMPADIDASNSAILGTHNSRSLNFVTNDSTRVVIDSLGNFTIPKLAFEPSAAGEVRFAYFDKNGNLSNRQATGPSISCGAGTTPWVLGGNTINTTLGNSNLIGPCNSGFVLQGNAIKSLILNNGKLGIGQDNGTPTAIADISDPSLVGSTTGLREHLRIYGDGDGKIEATGNMNLFYNQAFDINQGSPASHTSMFHIDNGTGAVSMAGSATIYGNGVIGGVGTIGGNASIGGNATVNGKIGIGTTAPSVKLDVVDATAAKVHVYTTGTNPAEVWTYNSSNSYAFRIDGTGMGRISNDISGSSPTNLLSFTKTSGVGAQVWVGDIRPTATVYTDFNFAVAGKLVAKSVYVTLNCTWADYVFDKNYKLPKLSDVELYYKANKHLPEVPNAAEVEEKGIDVAGMNALLLKKIEELTMYVVEINKEVQNLKKENLDLKNQK